VCHGLQPYDLAARLFLRALPEHIENHKLLSVLESPARHAGRTGGVAAALRAPAAGAPAAPRPPARAAPGMSGVEQRCAPLDVQRLSFSVEREDARLPALNAQR
jgi:hypothetical protein